MNDDILVQQLQKNGNLMDLLNDDAFLRGSAAVEAESDGYVEAGLGLKPYVNQLKAASPESLKRQQRHVRVLSILFPELRQWMEGWQLGLSFESVYTEAQRLMYGHLSTLIDEQQTWIDALLVEHDKGIPMDERLVRSQAISMMSSLLTKDDWQALATVAAQNMAKGVLQVSQIDNSSLVAA